MIMLDNVLWDEGFKSSCYWWSCNWMEVLKMC